MAQLQIGERIIEVDDSFLALPPQEQQKAVDEIEQSLGGLNTAAPDEQQSVTAAGLFKQAGVGLAKGAIGLAEFPAHVGQWLGEQATGAIDRIAGVPPEQIAQRRANARNQIAERPLDPVNLRKNIEGITGPFREPQNTPEQYVDTAAQFLAATPIGGATGMGSKLVAATAGGVGSEAAGQAAQKFLPEAEPYARFGGALLGGFAPALGRRAITPLPVSKERQGLLNVLKSEGVDLTAGQSSGRQGLRYAESELGGGKVANLMDTQGEQFTAAALKRAGITADRATPEVMDKAFTRIGNEFDGLAARNTLQPDAKLAQDVAGVVQDYANITTPTTRKAIVGKLANDILTSSSNGMSGKKYNALRSDIEEMARRSSDGEFANSLRELKHSLDEAMERTLKAANSPDLGAWQKVRREYRNIIVLEQAATAAGEKAAEGLISPSALRSATVTKHGKRNYARGDGDFADLARAGEATMKPLPQSGTAPRTAARAMGTSIPSLLGAFAGNALGDAPGFLLGGAAGAAIPYAMGKGLLSKPVRAYLKNQLLTRPSRLTASQRAILPLLGAGSSLNNSGR